MDPALHLQQRIAHGLNGVSCSLRNSFNSLVLGSSSAAAGQSSNAAASNATPANAAAVMSSGSSHAPPSANGSAAGISALTTVHSAGDGGTLGSNGVDPSTGADVDLEKGHPELERLRHRPGSKGGDSVDVGLRERASSTPIAQAAGKNGDPTPSEPRYSGHEREREAEQQRRTQEAEEALAEAEADEEAARRRRQRAPLTLQTLPPEVLMLVVHELNFGDIERLRRTNHFFRDFAAPRMVRALFGRDELRKLLLSHCASCLAYDEDKSGLLLASATHRDYPLCARCVDCAVSQRDERLVVGRKITMGDGVGVWVCRWCGWPVTADAALGHAQFHRGCYGSYNDTLLFYFLLGWLQLSMGIVAGALAWTYFRGEVLVFAPTVTSFILLWLCFFMLMFRGNRVRTYHWTFLVELVVLCLWIPPVYHIIPLFIETPHYDLPRSTMACLIIFCFNILFRLLNVLGNVVLMCEYQRTNHYLPKRLIPFWRRLTNPLADILIFWTYPQSVEQKYPPHWG